MTEEEMLDGVFALRKACMWMNDREGLLYCFESAKKGYNRLLGGDHAKGVEVTYALLYETTGGDKMIARLRAL